MTTKTAEQLLDEATPGLMLRMIQIAEASNDFDAIKYLLDKRIAKTKPETRRPNIVNTSTNMTPEAKCKMYLVAMENGVLSMESGETLINCALKLTTFDDMRAREEVLDQLSKITGQERKPKPRSF